MRKRNTKFKGSIDKLEAGFLYGWAINEDSVDPISLRVLADGKMIGFGLSDQFRGDLEEAGINRGNHAFKISVNEIISAKKEVMINLIEDETLQEIEHPKFAVPVVPINIYGELVRFEGGQIVSRVVADRPFESLGVELHCEEGMVFETKVESSDGRAEINLHIPSRLLDGKRHSFKLAVKGYANVIAMQGFVLEPFVTPWEWLKDSYRIPGFMQLSRSADYRYEALQLNLEKMASGESGLVPCNLAKLHTVIVEGYEKRTDFPAFSLPRFDDPRVSIIVPAYNKFALTYHCIASIAFAFGEIPYEVILADDCSTDETCDAEKLIDNLIVSRNPENLGFLNSCNAAVKLSSAEFIVFLNNDTEVISFWLDELVHALDNDPKIGMTGAKLLNSDGTLQEAGGVVWENGKPWNVGRGANQFSPEYNYAREVDYLSGAALCIRSDVWDAVDGFSEEYAPCYYEDTDLAFKVREQGFKTVYVPSALVIHFEGKSHGRDITKGLKKYQTVNEKKFQRKWFSQYKNNGVPGLEAVRVQKDRGIEQRILVIDYATPMPDKDAGSYAAIQEMKLMRALGFKITFVPDNMAHFGRYTADLQRMGIEVLYLPFYISVQDVLHRRLSEMDAVYITRFQVAEKYIDYIQSESTAKVLFNNADLHFLRELRGAITNGREDQELRKVIEVRDKELLVCRKADAVLCYNAIEHAVIASHILESDKLQLTPWVLQESNGVKPSFHERAGIGFIGNFNHYPNGQAVEFLVREVMPLLSERRTDITLSIYGSNMPECYKEFECENVKCVGYIERLEDLYGSHRIFVAPLLSGAGIKGKVLEAMARGIPCVLSEIAAEGTGLTNSVSAAVAKTPEQWVDSIIALNDDENIWLRYVENAEFLVTENHSFRYGVERMKEIFESVGIYSSVCDNAAESY